MLLMSLKIFAYWMRNYKNCLFYTQFKLFRSWLPFFFLSCLSRVGVICRASIMQISTEGSHERWTRWKTTEYRLVWPREDVRSQSLKCIQQRLFCVAELQVWCARKKKRALICLPKRAKFSRHPLEVHRVLEAFVICTYFGRVCYWTSGWVSKYNQYCVSGWCHQPNTSISQLV